MLLALTGATAYSQAAVAPSYKSDSSHDVVIRHIIITGNNVTRRAVILREMNIAEGDTVRTDTIPTLLEVDRLRLYNLTLFNEVALRMEQISATEEDLYIDLKERWFIIPTITIQFADRNFNTWYVKEHHDLHRAILGLTATDKNFRGDLETLAATVQVGYTQKLGIAYTRPYANADQTNGLGFYASVARSQQTYYATDSNKLVYTGNYTGAAIQQQIEAGISYIYRPAYASRHIFQLTYKDYWVADTVLKLNPDYFANRSNNARLLEFLYRYELNKVDNWNYPLYGIKLVTYATVRAGFQGINFQSFGHVEAGWFKNLLPRWYTSVIFRGQLMAPQKQPYYFQGGLGTQTDYVRGYEYYVIDGSNYGLLRLDLKREIFNKTYTLPIKYFTAIPFRIYPKIFADAGYINSPQPGNSFLSNHLLYSVGVGLDVVTLYDIKIRFEFAYNHLAQNGLYLHFNSE